MLQQQELTFKNVKQEKMILEMERIKSDLTMVINLIDLTQISRMLLVSNIKTIKRVEGIQNYRLSELMGKKLQHVRKLYIISPLVNYLILKITIM